MTTIGKNSSKNQKPLTKKLRDLSKEIVALKRQLEIEAALEKVRARTMAMQHSDELADTSFLMAQQIRELGIDAWGCAFHIYAEDESGDYEWFSNEEGYLPFYKTPRKNFFKRFYDKGQKGETLYIERFAGAACKKHYHYLFSLPVVGDTLKELRASGISLPTIQFDHVAYFKHGYLLFITYQEVPEAHEIFKRFAREFEQTYTRFLDLKKAEEQTREAQIEAALERVRASTMAMQSSEELYEVALVLREQMGLIGQAGLEGVAIHLYPKNADTFESWYATRPPGKKKGKLIHGVIRFSRDSTEVAREAMKAFESKQGSYTLTARGAKLKEWLGEVAKQAPEAVKNYEGVLPEQHIYQYADFSGGSLLMVSQKEPIQETKNLQKRAASVFDMAYKRFLDLKKAEEQAREARIEAALERVRARAMAMHKSDELAEVAELLYGQLYELGVDSFSCGYVFIEEEKDQAEVWMTDPTGNSWGVWTVPLSEDKILKGRHQSWKRKEKIHRSDLQGKDLIDHLTYIAKHTPLTPDEAKDFIKLPNKLVLLSAHFSHGYLLVVSKPPVTKEDENMFIRFAQVFELTYKRYLDLKKAEAQAREAEIELALERVRARTMAMRHSEELSDVAILLFKQVKSFGLESWGCGFNIWEKDEKICSSYFTTDEGLVEGAKIPLTEDPVFRRFYESRQNGEEFWLMEMKGEKQVDHFKYISTLPGVGEKIVNLQKAGGHIPAYQIDHGVNFSHGNLIFITYEPCPEAHDIFKRFGKVFDQTYTRFLDLRKAEEQAREAEIELAMERIRARTMAMHHSDELPEAAQLLFQQVQQLGIKAWSVGYNIWNEDKTGFISWMSDEGVLQPVLEYPVTEDPSMRHFLEAYERGESFFVEEIGGKALVKHYKYLRTLPGVADSLDSAEKAGFPVPTFQIFHLAYFSGGFLLFITYKQVPEAWNIFKRFGSVFEQTYTRFLDLKKAEEQAKEAQIEAALERVRARTMAMHNSNELLDAAEIFSKELISLEIPHFASGFVLVDEASLKQKIWMRFPGNESQIQFYLPLKGDTVLKRRYESWKSGEPIFHQKVSGNELAKHLSFVFKYFESESAVQASRQMPDPIIFYCGNFKEGYVHILSEVLLNKEQESILARFSSLFQQTYTRFLDLKKAEEQAREAQIEAALERVRARAMAMHSSDEILQVADVLREEMGLLGQPELAVSAVHIYTPGATTFDTWWAFVPTGKRRRKILTGRSKIRIHTSAIAKEFIQKHQSDQGEYTIHASGKKLRDWQKEVAFAAPKQIESYRQQLPKEQYFHFSDFTGGALAMVSYQEPSQESKDLQKRAATVFNLAYQRFLDLKKAEKQAREAQIEAALERVRARAMAMHKSEELAEAAELLYQQLGELGIDPWTCGYVFIEEEEDQVKVWMTEPDGKFFWGLWTVPLSEEKVLKDRHESWKRKEKIHRSILKGQDNIDHHIYIAEHSPITVDDLLLLLPVNTVLTSAHFSYGYLLVVSETQLSNKQENLLVRFAQVFELTYKRFLDLKKAEEQAREAQIEAALERVRARTMGMHKSEELNEVSVLLYDELKSLRVSKSFLNCGYMEIDVDKKLQYGWMSNPDGTIMDTFSMPLVGDPVLQKRFNAWKKGQRLFHQQVGGKELQKHLEFVTNRMNSEEVVEVTRSAFPETVVFYCGNFDHGYLCMISVELLTEEGEAIFTRFTHVFQQAYTRFLDLKKAEEQAREAQIEAALERVRARALAMNSSDELYEVALVLREQMGLIGQPDLEASVIHLYPEDSEAFKSWYAMRPAGENQGKIVQGVAKFRYKESEVARECIKAFRSTAKEYTLVVKGEKLKEWLAQLAKQAPEIIKYFRGVLPEQHIYHFSDFSGGSLLMVTYTEPAEESKILQKRAATVFDLAYKRFLDLKKAEEQAREAEIELALERVRARTMAMQHSGELPEVALVLWGQLDQLKLEGLPGCAIHVNDDEKGTFDAWAAFPDLVKGERKMTLTHTTHEQHCIEVFREWDRYYRAGETGFAVECNKQQLNEFIDWFAPMLPMLAEEMRSLNLKKLYVNGVTFSNGIMGAPSYEPLSEETWSVFKRLAGVFDLAYRRFEDLKKAEEQAREAKIEAALERVRSRSMAMQESTEIAEVLGKIFTELTSLDVELDRCIIWIVDPETESAQVWIASSDVPEGSEHYFFHYATHPYYKKFIEAWRSRESLFELEIKGRLKQSWDQYLFEESEFKNLPQKAKSSMRVPGKMFTTTTCNQYGLICAAGTRPMSEQSKSIFQRFGRVFEQSYTRFEDIKQAEEQAREAQIEAALERIRARTMGMRKSEEMLEVGELSYQELSKLDITSISGGITLMSKDENIDWYYMVETDSKSIMKKPMGIPRDETKVMRSLTSSWEKQESYQIVELNEKETISHQTYIAENSINFHLSAQELISLSPVRLTLQTFNFKHGYLLLVGGDKLPKDKIDIGIRFAKVFEQTYTRFLDLKKAEEQAREAQIEAALERVRASTMAMHSSEDVGKATIVLFQELENLGIQTLRCGVLIINENQTMEVWTASSFASDTIFNVAGIVDMTIHPLLKQLFKDWKSGKRLFTYELKGKDAERYYTALKKLPSYKLPQVKEWTKRHVCTGFLFKEGALFAFSKDSLTVEATQIFQKFTNVFTLTYRRFLDLKEAEARAAEAVLKSSLDRVRAEIASMRTAEDLQRITPLVWRELSSLGVPFFRCGVFIMDESTEKVHMYLSSPQGDPLAVLHLSFDEKDIPLVGAAISHWKTQTVHRTHWTQQQFKVFTDSLVKRGLIKSVTTYQQGEKPPENLNLHLVPFKQGMLYVGSSKPLADDQTELVHSLANAFSVAYARYQDFIQLEEAKISIENTLTELRAAQDQLIHAEKMASLGELTAGIAHEIQNPLNFVNNFSEVSGELIAELKQEIAGGNLENALEIGQDLIQNIEKIHHHGQRASSIVKGMLQHSRSGSDQKELTDINYLADEYLRLAYHGFRAKDKSFNANFKTVLADDLPKINVVPQDIGRVLLNLINNAFQAVRGVENPEVKVKTSMKEGTVVISVIDNGPGIPEDIKEKIFQPFFTTKPSGEGTGLGLSLSYDIVTKGHGGAIEINSELNGGATFKVTIPIST